MGDLFAPSHILLILIVVLLLFGPKKLPELGRAFGKTLREFKNGASGLMSDDEPSPNAKLPDGPNNETNKQ
ncbi:MAG TPA: twin-arginine translocase TatA/TatE family subunit [Bacilli bacterium]